MDIDNRCVVCNQKGEDGGHLYFKCEKVGELWTALGLSAHSDHLVAITSAREVVRYILKLPKRPQLWIALGMWMWWSERNKIREEGKRRPIHLIANMVEGYAGEIILSSAKEPKAAARRIQKWQKPAPSFLKVNCDASFHAESGNGGWGYVIRDEEGDLISAGRGKLLHVLDSFQAEVIVCLQGLQAAIDMGVSRVQLETDAMQVKQAVESTSWELTVTGGLIKEIQELAHLNCVAFMVSFVPRSCNGIAHALAVLGCVCGEDDDPIVNHLPICIQTMDAAESAVVE